MNGRSKIKVRQARRSRSRAVGVAGLELLERRQLLATFVVTNTGDLTETGAVIPGSFRAAILASNANPGADSIKFNIGGTGVQTIVVSGDFQSPPTPLPSLSDPVTIDATTQTGYGGSPLIQLVGNFAGTGADGLRVEAANTTIKGLAIDEFSNNGIELDATNATIQNNFIGIDPSGRVPLPNLENGIYINSGSNNTIGSDTPLLGNIISANDNDGILIKFGSNNRVLDNQIGTDITGGTALGNGEDGVGIVDSTTNEIGDQNTVFNGLTIKGGNLISGNVGNGVQIRGQSTGTTVQGNIIGLDVNGVQPVPNNGDGVLNMSSNQTSIGGVAAGVANYISSNRGAGIEIDLSNAATIQGDFIGTAADGTTNRGNDGPGVELLDATNSTIGGTAVNQPNIIAFNGVTSQLGGVYLTSDANGTTSGISILSNSIFSNVGTGQPTGPGGILFDSNETVNSGVVAPVLTNVVSGAGRTLVQGTLTGTPTTTYTLQFFSSPTADPSGFGQGKTFIGQETVTTNASGVATINDTLSSPTTVGNVVSATTTDSNGNTSEFSNSKVVGVASLADLAVTIAATPNPATLNSTITYTITATNNGPSTATNVSVVDTLPTSTIYQSSTTSQGTAFDLGQVVTASFGTIAAGETATLTVVVEATATGSIKNTATVSSNEIDPNTANNSASLSIQVNIPADLGITLTGLPNPQVIGQQLVYTAIVTNYGPGAATNATVSDSLPAGVSFVSASAGQGSAVDNNGIVTANLGTLPIGVSAAVRIVVTTSAVGTLTNTVTIASDENDPNSGNNTATVTTTVEAAADLILTGSAAPSPAFTGQTLTYTLNVANGGPSGATGINLTDLLPADSVFVSAQISQGTFAVSNGTLTANLGDLASFATASLTITVVPTVSEVIENGATVSAAEFDPNTKNNTITIPTAVSPADVAVSIASSPATPLLGQYTTLNVTVTNNGPATASNVVLTDILPANANYIGAAPPQGILSVAGDTLTVQFGSIPSGGSIVVPIVVVPLETGTLVDTASVTNPEYDPDPSNSSATFTAVISPADLAVSATSSASSLLLGGQISYTVTVTNNGPATATNVVLGDPVPSGFQFISASTTAGSIVGTGSTVFAAMGTLAAGTSAQATFVYQPLATGTYVNTFSANADQTDPNPANSVVSVTTDVFNDPGAFDFSSASYSVLESAGTATITINRDGGSQGAASVLVSTFGGSAVAGFDYSTVSQTLDFADGQTSATVTVPILDNGLTQPNTTVGLLLSNVTGGASLGSQSSAVLTIINTHPDLSGPKVLGLILQGGARSIPSLVIGFTKPLDPSTATNIANYLVTAPNGKSQPIASATYDPTTNNVTLTFSKALPSGKFYSLTINGTTAGAITDDLPGMSVLDGDGNGVAGGNYVATFERAPTIKYVDSKGNIVTFVLKKGGYLDIYRSANGDGQQLTISGANPYKSTLSGTVKPSGPSATGVTTLAAINGLEPFGTVLSTLTSPPFVVANTPSLSPALEQALATPEDLFPASVKRKK